MTIVTLTTDWERRDHYLASFKGEMLSRCPLAQVVDITHEVEHFDILQASFILKNCFRKFPEGTIHYIGLANNSNSGKRNLLIVKCAGHFFVGFDTGIFFLTLDDLEKEIVKVNASGINTDSESSSKIISIIKSITEENTFEKLGEPTIDIVKYFHTQPTVDQSSIRGTIIYVDTFGNLVVNISKELFYTTSGGRKFSIMLKDEIYRINKIVDTYESVEPGEVAAMFNQKDYLEIAVNQAMAAKLLALKMFDSIIILFEG